ncbi:preprotein translocase subunit SecG [Porphyromonas sp. COT-239 OH1446]|uniref:preprotein translocase subunit SecG n=1 Tax=Porphyromonas sp. COT-239 OH1446 TaxID=1515613 RepID=UPI000AE48AF6|nr:preprotein translocase subunit SecG [Porphyromonas sp. COT-239 OH1446]
MFIYTFLTVLIVLASLSLIFVVMIQKSKGGGLASAFSANNNIMGVRKTTDVVERTTWWLVGIVVGLSILSTAFYTRGGDSQSTQLQRAVEQRAISAPALPAAPVFGGDTPSAEPTATEATPSQPTTPESSTGN